jgi:hypothetical protein
MYCENSTMYSLVNDALSFISTRSVATNVVASALRIHQLSVGS